PDLSLKAGELAALGAGAKLYQCFSYQLNRADLSSIKAVSPDIILLVGGTDGGNRDVALHNARMLASSDIKSIVIAACNRVAQEEVESILQAAGKPVRLANNVMPEIGRLEVESSRHVIRDVFVTNIVKAKGMDKVKGVVSEVVMPTPTAVLNAAKLLSEGVGEEPGLGEIMVVDVGGATTDVHSVATGHPVEGAVMKSLLPEPYVKRTVEGDLGVRHNLDTLLLLGESKGILDKQDIEEARSSLNPKTLPESGAQRLLDMKLARIASEVAVERHVGRLEEWYGPSGRMLVQKGKDLRRIPSVIGTGGAIVFAQDPKMVLEGALFDQKAPNLLKPESPRFYLDNRYILYAIGLLGNSAPKKALRIGKQYLQALT
ncbi:MAG: glutamate mutase L, partial [Pseudomonadota bacterium]